jgi:splicing suppressor protein 51
VSQRQISTFESEAPVRETDFQYPGKAASLKPKPDGTSDLSRTVLGPNNLFHPLTESPIPSMRQRASFIKAHAYCPHPSHNRTRIATSEEDPETRKPTDGGLAPAHVKFECPHCGVPTFCSEDHWAEDYEEHMKVCDTLREINEDDHDLRSGRYFNEFDFPERYMEEAVSNFTNWDTLMYTRGFEAIDGERNMRHATRLLTYPVTVGSILHDLSPYNIRKDGRMTPEGLRSFTGM